MAANHSGRRNKGDEGKMSDAPQVVVDEPSAVARSLFWDKLWHGLRSAAWYETVIHRAASLWFLAQAIIVATGAINFAWRLDLSEISALRLADVAFILSRFATALFFTITAWLTLVRSQPIAKAPGIWPRLVALGAVLTLFAVPFLPLHEASTSLLVVSAGLALIGDCLALYVLYRLGRSFSVMSEARRLVTDGPYRIVRHPLYLTEEIAIFGIFLPIWSLPAMMLYFAHITLQFLRLRNEERVLEGAFPEYAGYAARTARLIPGLW